MRFFLLSVGLILTNAWVFLRWEFARLLAVGPRRVEEARLRFHRFSRFLIRSIEYRYGTICAIPTHQSPQFVIYWCASQTGKVVKVKVLSFKGLANRNDPKSCAWDSNAPGEALIGERAGQVLSCEIHDTLQSADVVSSNGRQHAVSRYARQAATLRSLRPCTCSETPCTGTGRARVRPEWYTGLHWEVQGRKPMMRRTQAVGWWNST